MGELSEQEREELHEAIMSDVHAQRNEWDALYVAVAGIRDEVAAAKEAELQRLWEVHEQFIADNVDLTQKVCDVEVAKRALVEQVSRLTALLQNLIDVHAQVVMDTGGDRDLHARAVGVFQNALNIEKDRLRAVLAAEPSPSEERTCPSCGRSDSYHGVVVEAGEPSRWACDECGHVEVVPPEVVFDGTPAEMFGIAEAIETDERYARTQAQIEEAERG